jgi:hypothetical protein
MLNKKPVKERTHSLTMGDIAALGGVGGAVYMAQQYRPGGVYNMTQKAHRFQQNALAARNQLQRVTSHRNSLLTNMTSTQARAISAEHWARKKTSNAALEMSAWSLVPMGIGIMALAAAGLVTMDYVEKVKKNKKSVAST